MNCKALHQSKDQCILGSYTHFGSSICTQQKVVRKANFFRKKKKLLILKLYVLYFTILNV